SQFRVLQSNSATITTHKDIFPQVDSRLLRAVAIEHPKDADIAAEIVLTEIIPSITKKLLPVTPPEDVSPRVIVNLEDGSEGEGDGLALAHHQLVKSRDAGSSSSNSSSRPDLNVPVKSRQGGSPLVVINLGDDNEEDDSEEEGGLVQKHQLVEDNAIGPSSSTSLSSRSIPVQIAQTANSSGGLDLNVTLNESTLSNGIQCLERKQISVWKSQALPNEAVTIENSSNSAPVLVNEPNDVASPKEKDNQNGKLSGPTTSTDESSVSTFMNQVSELIKLVDSRDIVELELKQAGYELMIRKKEALQPPPVP
ncbi:hypothetical protein RYX36_024435, partial [Vicia faba]